MTEELKPCPFCGSAAAMDQFEAEPWGGLLTVIGCSSSGCPISPTTDEVPAEIAIAAWNARAEADGKRIAELDAQIDKLADFIMHRIECEPSQSEGAVDTAIRIMVDFKARIAALEAQLAEAMRDLNAHKDALAQARGELGEQLAEARDKALEDAAVAYEAETNTWTAWPEAGAARRKGAKAIRALKGSQQ